MGSNTQNVLADFHTENMLSELNTQNVLADFKTQIQYVEDVEDVEGAEFVWMLKMFEFQTRRTCCRTSKQRSRMLKTLRMFRM